MPFLTTTLVAELGHNTSANAAYNKTNFVPNFSGITWVNNTGTTLAVDSNKSDDSFNPITPAHVSPVSVKTMIPNFSGKWYAHLTPWFTNGGGGGHINIGLTCNSTTWVNAALTDIKARGFDGVIVDYYGQTNPIDAVVLKIKAQIGAIGGTYHLMVDAQSYSNDFTLTTILNYIVATYYSDTNYQKVGGVPIISFFNVVGGVNYATVKAAIGVPMYWMFQGPGQLANAWVDAAFDWVQPWATGVPADRYNAAATNSFLTSVHASAKGTMPCISPGFNGYLTANVGWSKGKYMPRDNGQCWLSQAATVNANLPTNIIGIQVPTWDDWEEGSQVESPIDNQLVVSASIAGNILSFGVTGGLGTEATLDSYRFIASPDGVNVAVLGTQATGGSHTFDLSTVTGWSFGVTYQVYVIAVGRACFANKVSTGQSYTTANTPTGQSQDIGFSGGLTLSRWRPPSFSELFKTRPGSFHQELDRAVQTAYANQDVLERITVQGPSGTSGLRISAGSTTVIGSSLGVVTGLSTVTDVTASIDSGSTAINEWVSATMGNTTGTISLFVWKPTATNDTTPIASTTARTIRWQVKGS